MAYIPHSISISSNRAVEAEMEYVSDLNEVVRYTFLGKLTEISGCQYGA